MAPSILSACRTSLQSWGVREFFLFLIIGFTLFSLIAQYVHLRQFDGTTNPVSDYAPSRFSLNFYSLFADDQYWRFLTSQFLFGSVEELILGSITLFLVCGLHCIYSQRTLLLSILTCMVSSSMLETALLFIVPSTATLNPGYGVVFGLLLNYIRDMPYSWRCKIRFGRFLCPFFINDKWITYIFGLQLMFSQFPLSVYTAITAFVGGLACRLFLLCRFKQRPDANSDYNSVPEDDRLTQLADEPIELPPLPSSTEIKSPNLMLPDSNIDMSSLTSNLKSDFQHEPSVSTNSNPDEL